MHVEYRVPVDSIGDWAVYIDIGRMYVDYQLTIDQVFVGRYVGSCRHSGLTQHTHGLCIYIYIFGETDNYTTHFI